MQETPVWFLGGEDPLEKGQAIYSSILGLSWWLSWWRTHLQWGRPGFNPWVGKIPWRRAWQPIPVFLPRESPWTEEPGELKSMGLQRVGQDWVTFTFTFVCSVLLYKPCWILKCDYFSVLEFPFYTSYSFLYWICLFCHLIYQTYSLWLAQW